MWQLMYEWCMRWTGKHKLTFYAVSIENNWRIKFRNHWESLLKRWGLYILSCTRSMYRGEVYIQRIKFRTLRIFVDDCLSHPMLNTCNGGTLNHLFRLTRHLTLTIRTSYFYFQTGSGTWPGTMASNIGFDPPYYTVCGSQTTLFVVWKPRDSYCL